MTDKWNLIIDVALCENCHCCTLSVKDEHCGNDFPGYAAAQPEHGHEWIRIQRHVRGQAPHVDVAYLPTTCNHCDAAPCIARGGDDGAVYQRPDGIVIIDPEKAKGRRDLVDACPYGAIWWNEERSLPQKWIFDAHLIDSGWSQPRCAQVCPTAAIIAVKTDDATMRQRAIDEGLQVLRPELGAKPRVYYRNLHRYTECFLAGSVLGHVGGRAECVAGATVRLRHADGRESEAITDAFGDFKFDRLSAAPAHYRLFVSHPDFASHEAGVSTSDSLSLEPIDIGPARAVGKASA
jgi:Fe-S-cluster-containing dehydrogenase component